MDKSINEQYRILEEINSFLGSLDGIDEYVIVLDGFPIYWDARISSDRAEELAALATDIVLTTSKFIGANKESELMLLFYEKNKYTAVAGVKNVIFLARGEQNIVANALKNIIGLLNKNLIKCGWCNYNLSLSIVKCPKGHRLPMKIRVCPLCGSQITYIKCPKCGRLISPSGNRVVVKRPRSRLVAGFSMGVASLLTIILGISFIYNYSFLASVALLIAGGILAGLSYNELVSKTYIEIK